MLSILNSLNAKTSLFSTDLMILVSKFMVHRALVDTIYLSLGLLSPLNVFTWPNLRPSFCLKRKTGLTHMEAF